MYFVILHHHTKLASYIDSKICWWSVMIVCVPHSGYMNIVSLLLTYF